MNTKNLSKFKKVLKDATVISKNLVPVITKAVAEHYIGLESIQDALVATSKGMSQIFEDKIDLYVKKKKGIGELKSSLSWFLESSDCKPLIFIIDELDRCRPNYAVELLEHVKHFFSIPNIVFVLSADKIQLGNAVRGVYGSDRIDADEYLRHFIDVEYSLPKPAVELFYNHLYKYFNLSFGRE